MSQYIKHSMTDTAEHNTWRYMKQRCYNHNCADFKYYGARGIEVCAEWKDNFLQFYIDMGDRPSKDHSIDRIDNNKGYSSENCRWATSSQQARNRRIYSNNTSGVTGVHYNSRLRKWFVQIGYGPKQKYLGVYPDFFEAVCARKSAENRYWHNNSEVGT